MSHVLLMEVSMRCNWCGRFAQIPEKMWRRLEPLLPRYRRSRKGGRPRVNLRGVANGIFYLLRTGCQWKALPPQFGSPSTVHRYFQEWSQHGYFIASGKNVCKRMTRDAGSAGVGKHWTEP